MAEKTGSSTITYRLKLRCKHPDWVRQTEALYNEVLGFYHGLLKDKPALLHLGNMELLRKLEQMTVVGRSKEPVPAPIPFQKVPLYFRRAAINAAIGHIRSHAGLMRDWEQKKADAEQKGMSWSKKKPSVPQTFHASVLFYKGMFKEFGQGSILLKLWNGRSWAWVRHTYCGREIPADAVCLSPTVVIHGKTFSLHVPVKCPVEDTRTVKERVDAGERFCAVHFTASDTLAACVLFSSDGHATDSYFIRGGKEFAHRRKCLLNTIGKNRNAIGGYLQKGENRIFWRRVGNLSTHYAHLISRRIIDYCQKNNVKVLVVPKYEEAAGTLYGQGITGFLGKRIIQYLNYKAWRTGIVLTTIRPHYTAANCYQCGMPVRRYNEGHPAAVRYYGGRLFLCPNGHKGNTSLNAAKNLGNQFQRKFGVL